MDAVYEEIDPSGDLVATLFEPSRPFAPFQQVEQQLVDPHGEINRPATVDSNDRGSQVGADENGKYQSYQSLRGSHTNN